MRHTGLSDIINQDKEKDMSDAFNKLIAYCVGKMIFIKFMTTEELQDGAAQSMSDGVIRGKMMTYGFGGMSFMILNSDISQISALCVALHELAHWDLKHGTPRTKKEWLKNEYEANFWGAVLAEDIGIEVPVEYDLIMQSFYYEAMCERYELI
jgi:hypothetical protein